MRLINADELKKAMWEAKGHYPTFSDVTLQSIYKVIDNAPTVEEVSIIELKEPLPPVKAQKIVMALNKRPQGELLSNRGNKNEN